jgi:hypothetical protein
MLETSAPGGIGGCNTLRAQVKQSIIIEAKDDTSILNEEENQVDKPEI